MVAKSAILVEQAALERDYGRAIRSNVRALWAGVITLDDFFDRMAATIDRGIRRAWFDGAARCGILPDELTTKEHDALVRLVIKEKAFIFNFALVIDNGSKENGGLLRPLMGRASMWTNRALESFQRGEAMACADKKKEWVLGQAEHCKDCPRLNGKVKRLSWWLANNLIPQTPNQATECAGWKCQCTLKDTSKPLSRGRMPKTG